MSQPLTIEHLVSFMDIDETVQQKFLSDVIAGQTWTQVSQWTSRQWSTRINRFAQTDLDSDFYKDIILCWAKWLFSMYHLHSGHRKQLALCLTEDTCAIFIAICLGAEYTTGNTFDNVLAWVELARKTTPEGPLLPILDHIAVFALHL
uniref:Uncharacterized protein n=1 Tax=Grammatophora oceanica TaxID=210454 RepID=A0A7S1V8P0_9STRA|mmetsp:Transcript_39740/g.58963  ORF Transcript_39740/g.58963 Transcript_39740/m.58963 type:complete len:148 (+) Transcript_39740:118-561(+)